MLSSPLAILVGRLAVANLDSHQALQLNKPALARLTEGSMAVPIWSVPIWSSRSGPGNGHQPAKIIVLNHSCAPLMAVPVFAFDGCPGLCSIHCAQMPRTRRKTSLGAHRPHKECLPMNVVLRQYQTHQSSPVGRNNRRALRQSQREKLPTTRNSGAAIVPRAHSRCTFDSAQCPLVIAPYGPVPV